MWFGSLLLIFIGDTFQKHYDVNITALLQVILLPNTNDFFLFSSTLMSCICSHVQDALTDPQRVRTPDITEYWKPLADDVSICYY